MKENRAYITFLEGMSSDIASIKQKVEGDTANKNDIAMLRQQMSEMVAAQEERVKDETQAHSNILESVSSGIGELKRKLDGEAANKEDISMLGKKIDDLKIAQEERDVEETKILEGISSDIDELRRKVGEDTATKDDITMLEHTIVNSLKAAHDKLNTQSKNSGNSSLAAACLRMTQGEGGKGKCIALPGCGSGSVYLEWLLIEIKSVVLVPYWYLRAVCCKNRLKVCKIEKSDFLKICQNNGGCKLQVAGCRLQVAGCRLQVAIIFFSNRRCMIFIWYVST